MTKTRKSEKKMMTEREERGQYELIEYARINTLYHRRRQAFFESWEGWIKVLSIVAGSGAVVAALQPAPLLGVILAATVAVANAATLAFGTSRKAVLHNTLARRWFELEGELIAAGDEKAAVANVEQKIPAIEQEEPPILTGLARACERQVLHSMGHKVKPQRLRERLFGQFIDFQSPA